MSRARAIAVMVGAAMLWLWMALWYAAGRAAGVVATIAALALLSLQTGYRDGRWSP